MYVEGDKDVRSRFPVTGCLQMALMLETILIARERFWEKLCRTTAPWESYLSSK